MKNEPPYSNTNTFTMNQLQIFSVEYTTLVKAHGTPEADLQLICIGKTILSNARIFADAIEKWNNKPDVGKTWSTFKKHFTAAQINYKKARPSDTTGMH